MAKMWISKTVPALRVQQDVVTEIHSNFEETHIFWMDVQDRLIETKWGCNREITGTERVNVLKKYGWEILI